MDWVKWEVIEADELSLSVGTSRASWASDNEWLAYFRYLHTNLKLSLRQPQSQLSKSHKEVSKQSWGTRQNLNDLLLRSNKCTNVEYVCQGKARVCAVSSLFLFWIWLIWQCHSKRYSTGSMYFVKWRIWGNGLNIKDFIECSLSQWKPLNFYHVMKNWVRFRRKVLFFSHGNFTFYFAEEKKVRSILVSCFYMVHYIFLPVKMQ